MSKHSNVLQFDTVVIGGGIAGLWLSNRLNSAGYNNLLLEQSGLGDQQSVASQGMIHGGMKYALAGALTGASEAIADMPKHWADCLAGQGDVDLRGASVLSQHFYMWASPSVTARVTTFFASKALRGRVDNLSADQYPPLLQAAQRKFDVYKLVDVVLDVPSVVKTLRNNLPQNCRLIDWQKARLVRTGDRVHLEISSAEGVTKICAQRFMFTAGKGNQALLEKIDCRAPEMQTRPLQQVMVKHNLGYEFYGHCLGTDKTPRLTISSHPTQDGEMVWYLGGSLAEKGVALNAEDLIQAAQKELAELMPWIDLSQAQWATLNIDRAEPKQHNFARPDKAFTGRAEGVSNVYVGWPTKLTLAPNMAAEILAQLQADQIAPSHRQSACDFLPEATLAPTPWQLAFAAKGASS
ncbi:FAD-dependent oxidoreductase [Simiduia curdlanivorans]|uniref:FAD-dependent oxidoreductase n=1 Tax=Simiduia curdlanivorans TaxID=1492769 RepID=A0ABV8V2Z0_9GAMM|nr:FAD-dependent oxidoreductase [Simiduia curdlanivorans]MDN3637762.1 FAD-dependent oxidoreductase [Simiduia curdlanivorans]